MISCCTAAALPLDDGFLPEQFLSPSGRYDKTEYLYVQKLGRLMRQEKVRAVVHTLISMEGARDVFRLGLHFTPCLRLCL